MADSGSPSSSEDKFIAHVSAPSVTVQTEQLGPPGIKQFLTILAVMPNEQRRDEDRLHDRTERQFKVLGQLSKNPPATGDVKGDFGAQDGGSYLTLPDNAELIRVQTSQGTFEIKKNSSGEKSLIEFKCTARSHLEARRKFQTAVLPFLDHLSYMADCPVVIATLRIEDPKNYRVSIEYVSPYRKTTVNPGTAAIHMELQPVYAMYREAKNSYSDFYKFLCYYKILEGLLGKLRGELFSRAHAESIDLGRPKEVVPVCPEIPETYKPYVGKSIKAFFDTVLTPKFRNAVAHFVTDDGSILNMSSPEHIDRFAEVRYVSEICVRTAIGSYESMLNTLHGKRGA